MSHEPELGSGALREALEKLIATWRNHPAARKDWDGADEIYDDCAKELEAALSLSSPIEPRPEVEAWNEGYDAGFGAATLKHTNPEEFARRAEHTKEVVTRAVAKWEGINAEPTSQASSEIREAHGIRLTAKGRELLEQIIEEERKENPEGVARIEAILALAPSRQGADGK